MGADDDYWTPWEPTAYLRWLEGVLQQKWTRMKIDGQDRLLARDAEWRTVPTEKDH